MPRASRENPPSYECELDARGLNCPMPALRARAALRRMQPGQVLRIVSTDPGSQRDFVLFAQKTGNTLVARSTTRREFVFYLRRA